MYSQNEEEKHILEFFKDTTGTLLDIGANDGKTFSNSLALIEKGWKAVLVEPSEVAMRQLRFTHQGNPNVITMCIAVGIKNGVETFHESGEHLGKGDFSLLSTLKEAEKLRWNKTTEFRKKEISVMDYATLCAESKNYLFDFITIDAEGMDIEILKQIDLTQTKLLCIEWNSIQKLKDEILNYTALFDMAKIIYESPENLLIAR